MINQSINNSIESPVTDDHWHCTVQV